ncbi:hypothetical protein C0995_015360 [Termitomyces sp. Mi166|nr:hypothetical protein C0995_015360 [Termitomyces sp. Mi166\
MSPQEETPFTIAVSDDQAGTMGYLSLRIKRLVNRWKNGFDWRKQEAVLNADLPQFTRDIDVEGHGILNIHYVHKKSEVKGAIPLLFVHGCKEPTNLLYPLLIFLNVGLTCFIEFRKVLPLLIGASPDHPSFHVVALNLPGYGFSTAPSNKDFEIPQYAEVSHKLMLALGYDEYVTQGGDWGGWITRKIAAVYGPKQTKAWHTNFPTSGPPTISRPLLWLRHAVSGLPLLAYNKNEKAGFERTAWYRQWSSGYYAEQTTRPQTIGYSLADSPVGLLAWIYEKLVEYTDNYKWDDDEILTWISVYWFSRAGPTASIRIYYEALKGAGGKDLFSVVVHTKIPVGYSHFQKEVAVLPRSWTRVPNLVFEAEHDEGGHFAAYEKPEILVGDLRKMFGKGGGAFGVVESKNGYDA